ncbi:MAG: 1-acyl-sn-glycerol-3-phosphate acyltransferase [Clostridia bacterium]|nr:1-acyl-sn-glycerol-3-phosphate acyltransferase [Clostridia bacterium]
MKKKNKLFSPRYLFYDFVKLTAGLPGLLLFRPKWVYESEKAKKRIRGGALVAANHYGFFDPLYVMFAVWYRRHRFICGKEFFESRARLLFRAFLCIPIDRENFNVSSLRAITDALLEGSLVSMFPEGRIAEEEKTGELGAFKSGMALMALRAKVPIVPVYVKPRKSVWQRARFAIGEPIDVAAEYAEAPSFATIEKIAREVRDKEEFLKTLV